MIPAGSTAMAFGEVRRADERHAVVDGVAAPAVSSRLARSPDPASAGRPAKRLLDLFCGAGGAAKGYQRAGFYVVGVDINPQPHYCGDEFHQADALAFMERMVAGATWEWLGIFDVIHASPPCKRWTVARAVAKARAATLFDPHPNLLAPTRSLLRRTGKPYVIENVPGAPLIDPIVLCGSSFGLRVRRHRLFESNVPMTPPACDHASQPHPVGVYGNGGAWKRTAPGGGGEKVAGADAADALGIDWTTYQPELAQAIPPAYTEWIGAHLLAAIDGEAFALDLEPPPGLGSNTAGGSGSNGTANATVHEGTARRSRGAEPSAAAVPQT